MSNKYHRGAATWVVFEWEKCRLLERGTGKRAGWLLIMERGFPTWVHADRCYPS